MNRPGLSFRPRACRHCGGDAYLDRSDDPEWRCLQCGRVVPETVAVQDAVMARVAPTVQRAA